jgi:hypothetical protein
MMGVVRVTLYVVGIIAIAMGLLWILQGAGVVPIGFMAHQTPWIYRGAMLAFAGVVLALVSRSMRKTPPPSPPPAD